MTKEDIILEYTRLALEYSELPVNAETAELYSKIAIRKKEIISRIEQLRKMING